MLIANFLGQRLLITPVALLPIMSFALLAGYPSQMVAGTALAGAGLFIISLATAPIRGRTPHGRW